MFKCKGQKPNKSGIVFVFEPCGEEVHEARKQIQEWHVVVWVEMLPESSVKTDRSGLRSAHQDESDRVDGGHPQGHQEPGRGRWRKNHPDEQSHA